MALVNALILGFVTIQINTALKLQAITEELTDCFVTIQINTALKLVPSIIPP